MDLVNIWSVGHLFLWLSAGFVFHSWCLFIFLSVMWEVIEVVLPYDFSHESWENKVADILINSVGFVLGQLLRQWFANSNSKSKTEGKHVNVAYSVI